MKSVKIIRVISVLLILFVILWGLGWLFLGAYYCNPNAEDFSLCTLPRDEGILFSVVNLLTTYDGRYFTNFLHGFNPLAFDWLAGYKLMPVIGVLFFVVSFWFFLVTVFKAPSKLKLFIFSFLFAVIHFAQAPSLPHDLYWMVSSFVYLYPWSFIFLWLGAYWRYIHVPENRKGLSSFWFIATILFLICCIGMNEMFLITNIVLLLGIARWSYSKNNVALFKTIPILVVGISAISFFITSPGISFRLDDNMKEDASFFYVKGLVQSAGDFAFSMFCFLKNGMVLSLSGLVLLHANSFQSKHTLEIKNGNTRIQVLIVLAFVFVAYLMTMAYYLPMQTDTGYPSRIFNSVVILIQLIIVLIIPLQLKQVSKVYFNRVAVANKLSLLVLVVLCTIMLTLPSNISVLHAEFDAGRFEVYNKNMQNRYRAIQESKRDSKNCLQVAEFDRLIHPPSTIYYGPDIQPNRAKGYWNNAYEVYFKIDQVKLKGDSLLF